MNTEKTKNETKGYRGKMEGTAFTILVTIGVCHFLNDMIQSIIPSIYPIIKEKFGFTFAQIGVITLIFQLTSSILQPFTGRYADRHPQPYALYHRHVLHISRTAYDGCRQQFLDDSAIGMHHRVRIVYLPS